jgi:hypothetical protein
MFIPEYWAEASRIVDNGKRRLTLRRFGWSNEDQEAAQLHANQRLDEAVANWELDPSILRRERKVAYNGSDGVPIREEVIDSNEHYVITRNTYGALCLNTQNVLIADVDQTEPNNFLGCLFATVLLNVALVAWIGRFYLFAAALFAIALAATFLMRSNRNYGSKRSRAKHLQSFENFSINNPSWGLRVYETPLGFRLIATHGTFDPQSSEVTRFFRAIEADRVYERMCQRQNCFRARLTAKPWRCGIKDHMFPRAVWPIKEEHATFRQAWIERYQAVASGCAACRFVRKLGFDAVAPGIDAVVSTHDKLTQCHSDLPLA